MAGRSPARFIAPLALVAFALALFIVVSSTKDDGNPDGARDAAQPAQSTASPNGGGGKKRKRPRSYTVKAGDTPSGIAEKVNVPLGSDPRAQPRSRPADADARHEDQAAVTRCAAQLQLAVLALALCAAPRTGRRGGPAARRSARPRRS